MKPEILAWRKYPEPNGTAYFAVDLIDRAKVIELFDYCQILEATISDGGWAFLFEHYGLSGILEIDNESKWLEDEDPGEWISSVYDQALISGFDPQKMEFGEYSQESGIFTSREGVEREMNWKEIYDLKDVTNFSRQD